ncbi:methanol dehydrogenase [cytochrome c] subunit [Alcaligenes endophyticus]|uniref:Methanol dehydrogenase [cytochrome c] subunit 2 n=1 Tax=Alcaligenes endophyticus TaxID=1929088 RepID=A0ABT8EJF0_9BURK|nr:methanol dehydrogenase [cytochrome c] subunit [Alcaligenes endophyticus]MCX5591644.1 methanol dehydrogenase [cytochrome c] subunit [Alcaligenes endophyticus]MDN4121322.1 methanol dehydrogenase [cytochrome c] subunit [Alcaligenes endophyticus]
MTKKTLWRRFGNMLAVSVFSLAAGSASAYTGTECKEPGNCWQAKPGYPEQIAGSKYDPKHDPKELAKQQESIQAMEARNKQRVEHYKKTGKFIYDVKKIPAS